MHAVSRAGQMLKGKYVLEVLLGAGGMGEVYRARNTLLDRTVAIKLLHQEMARHRHVVERFMREAKAANVVRHRNIVDVLDIDSDESGALFIVQEYLEGEDLAAHLDAAVERRMPVGDAIEVLLAVAGAVGAAHERGVVHRDLKPDNVFLSRAEGDIVPKVLDFGISKLPLTTEAREPMAEAKDTGSVRLTAAGSAMGTPAYMSPEQIRDPASVDARTDVWALGVMLYEAISGTLPFDADNLAELFAQICTTEPAALDRLVPELPPGLARVVRRCLRPDPAERYADARELAGALLRVKESVAGDMQLGISAPPIVSLPAPEPPARGARIESADDEEDSARFFLQDEDQLRAAHAPTLPGLTLEEPRGRRSDPAARPVPSARVTVVRRASLPARDGDALDGLVLLRLLLGALVSVSIAFGAAQLAPSRIAELQLGWGPWAVVPFAASALVMLGASIYVVVQAARLVSYSLFASSLGGFTLAAACAAIAALLGAPGWVADTPRRMLLVAGPWAGAAFVGGLALFAALQGRRARREDGGLIAHLLLAAGVLGLLAAVYLGRSSAVAPGEAARLRLVPAEHALSGRARQLAILCAGLEALEGRARSPLGRSTRGGEAAAAAVNPQPE